MTDEAAKRGISIAMVLGVALGVAWALALDYSLLQVRAWNAVGVAVITTLSIFALFAAIRGYAVLRRSERRERSCVRSLCILTCCARSGGAQAASSSSRGSCHATSSSSAFRTPACAPIAMEALRTRATTHPRNCQRTSGAGH